MAFNLDEIEARLKLRRAVDEAGKTGCPLHEADNDCATLILKVKEQFSRLCELDQEINELKSLEGWRTNPDGMGR